MRARLGLPLLILSSLVVLSGCVPVIVAGGATAAVATTDRRTLGSFLDDEAIELKSRKALNSDEKLGDEIHVNITSVNGVVLLTGEAENNELLDRVLTQVRSVAGIRRIVNEIRIAPPREFTYRTNDAWITGKVKSKMLSSDDLDAHRIKVVTENSVVYLMGLVKKTEADLATEATRSVAGVKRVVKLFEYID